MVNKKKSLSNKKDFLIASLFLIAIGFMVFVLAANEPVVGSPQTWYNYSGTMFFNCTSTMESPVNVSLYYNASGGAVDILLVTVLNDTGDDNQSVFNSTVDISDLPDGTNYNFTCVMSNATATTVTTVYATAIPNVTIDNTAPNVSSFSSALYTQNNGNYSGTIVLNASADDVTIGMGAVYFNVTFSNGTFVTGNFTEATNSGNSYSVSLITNGFQDGYYNITVYANDSSAGVLINGSGDTVTNLNSTEHIQIAIDNTAPSSVTLTSANDSRTSITATIAAVDATTGISGTCRVDRTKAVVTGTGAAQVLREDNLVCGQSYNYVVTCTDYTSHSKSSSTTTFSTDACSSGWASSGGSGTTATHTWTNTYTTSDTQFAEGFTKQLSVNNRVRVTVSGLSHHVGVKEVTATSATIEIASEPVEVNLDVGEEAKVDVTDNGYYDIYVKLNAIVDGKADVTVMKINELMPEDADGSVDTTGDIVDETDTEADTTDDEEGGLTWLWVIIGILVLAAVIGGGVAAKKKK